MKKIIFGLVATSCLVGANGFAKSNKTEVKKLEPLAKRINGDSPHDYYNTIYCANSFYFENLSGYHVAKLNSNRKNGLVVIQQLLGYYDTMIDDQVIPETYEWKVDSYISNPNNPTMDQFNDSPASNESFYNHLKSIYINLKYTYDESKGTTHAQDKKVLRKIWKEYNPSITETNIYIEPCDNNLADRWNNYSYNLVIDQINSHHNPVIVRKDNEVGIAYAFNNQYVWVATFDEMGGYWNGVMKKPISFIKNAQVLAVNSCSFQAIRAYSDNYAFYTTQAKKWIGTHNHVLSTPNFNGYHEYYMYTDYAE